MKPCDTCNGSGEVMNGRDLDWHEYWIACPDCGGSGKHMVKQEEIDAIQRALESEKPSLVKGK